MATGRRSATTPSPTTWIPTLLISGATIRISSTASRPKQAEWLDTGKLEPHTIYVIDLPSALRVAGHLGKTDLLATIDDRIVLAKDGAALVDGLGIMPQTRLVD